jgi:hypothetical protein
MKIAKGTLMFHHMCMICDSKFVTKYVKCYISGSPLLLPNSHMGKKLTIQTGG